MALVVGAIAIVILNVPGQKRGWIQVHSESVSLDRGFSFQPPGFARVRLRGFSATIGDDLQGTGKNADNGRTFRIEPGQITLTPGGRVAPSMTVTPTGAPGPMSVTVDTRATWRIGGGGTAENPAVGLEAFPSARLNLHSDGMNVEANRLSLASGGGDQFDLHLSGLPGQVSGEFHSVRTGNPSILFKLVAAQEESLVLLEGLPTGAQNVEFDGPIRLEGELAGKPLRLSNADAKLRLDGAPLQVARIELIYDSKSHGWLFQTRCLGTLRSILLADEERLPTKLDEILASTPAQKGVYGMLAAFAILAATVFLNRALNVLAGLCLPDPGSKKSS